MKKLLLAIFLLSSQAYAGDCLISFYSSGWLHDEYITYEKFEHCSLGACMDFFWNTTERPKGSHTVGSKDMAVDVDTYTDTIKFEYRVDQDDWWVEAKGRRKVN